ncbi:MAG: hypothetical protein OEY01_12625 [Desulfobulbaceae bacterium]|nr:hypothetical protein [Desulfobulbaceae bacterium]HIJ79602.1 hypothetical protein [Deltaproteobacteria bacterium]
MDEQSFAAEEGSGVYEGTDLLQLRVDEDLYRAFQRSVWIIINETGRTQIDIMNEMVRDFLIKHRC